MSPAFAWLDRRGDIAAARALVPILSQPFQQYYGETAYERVHLFDGYLALHEAHYDVALDHFHQAAAIQQRTRHMLLSSDARFGIARAYLARGKQLDALDILADALEDWHSHRMPGVVMQEGRSIVSMLELAAEHNLYPDFVQQVLTLLGQNPALPKAEITLTRREQEILTWMSKGFTNQGIADRLVIATSTVKRHTANIYHKLGVSNRAEAVARAYELKLL